MDGVGGVGMGGGESNFCSIGDDDMRLNTTFRPETCRFEACGFGAIWSPKLPENGR